MATNVLFVYGTLRPGSPHPMARYLAKRGKHLGGASARGRLYNLGRYPGMVETSSGSDRVQGDVYELPEDDGKTLADLDRYENGESPHPAFFDRQVAEVRLRDGSTRAAWLYWFRGPVSEQTFIESGDWLATVNANVDVAIEPSVGREGDRP